MGSKAKTIGDIVELVRGNTYKSALLDQPGPMLLGLASIERNGGFRSDKLRTYGGPSSEKHLVYPGDMYVSLKDITQQAFLLGSIARVPNEINVGRMTQDTVKLLFKDTTYSKELFYWVLRTPQYKEYCKGRALGTTNLSLSRDDFLAYELPEEDKKRCEVVNLLENIESKASLSNQINQTLEQMAQALFKSWFVNFDPVVDNALDAGFFEQDLAFSDELLRRAEARRAVREHDDFKQLPEATRQLFPAAFEECSEPSLGLGGWLPQGWKIAMLDEITCELRRGVSPKYVEEGGVQVINQKCIRNHEVSYEPARRHDHEAKKIDGRELCIGDVLVNSTGVGTLGRIAQVTYLPETTVVDSHVTVVRVKDDVCPIYTFGQLMLSMEGKIEQLGEGSTGQTELSRKILSEQLVILPPFDIAAQVEKTFKSFSEKQVSNRQQCSTLTNLRDTLLPKLISGELRLDQIEADLAKEGMA